MQKATSRFNKETGAWETVMVDLTPEEIAEITAIRDAPPSAVDVKREVSRRIVAVLKDSVTQINMTAYGTALTRLEAAGTITPEQKATLDVLNAAQMWVLDMQAKGRALIAAGDKTFREDRHWPAVPSGVASLVQAL